MLTATARPTPSDLFHYLPAYQVLICKKCQYAIQPSAIPRHLKELHHIYRSNRRGLVEFAKGLQLADPRDVVLPQPHEAPVPFLPTEDGLACGRDECTHLCVSIKRMQSHWATVHEDIVESGSPQWHPVALQTFFRGNQLRYFIVSPPCTSEQPSTQDAEMQSVPIVQISEATPLPKWGNSWPLPPDWTPGDIVLFNHFTQFTYNDMGRSPMSRQMWRAPIPEMAVCHDFLRHGILACSALHLAYLNPLERRRYHRIAASHQARALPQFRALVGTPTDETCHALLAFSHLLLVHCFAAGEQDETMLLVKQGEKSGLPDWLQVVRGSCTLFRHVWSSLKNGPMKPLIEENMQDKHLPIDNENPEPSGRFKHLLTLPVFGGDSIPAEIPPDQMTAYFGTLIILAGAYERAQAVKNHGTYNIWTVVQIWPARVPLEYLELLRTSKPAALVLLANYCTLLGPLEDSWYMHGFRKKLLERIYWQLDDEWWKWLDLPFAEAGLTPPGRTQDVRCDPLQTLSYLTLT